MRQGSFLWATLIALAASGAWAAAGDQLVVTGDGVNVRSEPSTSSSIRMRVYSGREVTEIARDGEWVRVEVSGEPGEGWIHESLLAPAGGQAAAAPPATAAAAPAPSPEQPAAPAPERRPAPESVADQLPQVEPEPSAAERAAAPTRQEAALRPEPPVNTVEPAAGPVAVTGPELARFKESVEYLNTRAVQVAGVNLFTGVQEVDADTVKVGTTDAWSTVPPAGQRSYLNTLVDRWAAAKGGEGPVSVQITDPSGQVVAEQEGP